MSKIIFKLTILTALIAVALTAKGRVVTNNRTITRSQVAAAKVESECQDISLPFGILKLLAAEKKIALPSGLEVVSCTVSSIRNLFNGYKMTLTIGNYDCNVNLMTFAALKDNNKRPDAINADSTLESLKNCIQEADEVNSKYVVDEVSNDVEEETTATDVSEDTSSSEEEEEIVSPVVETRINCHSDRKLVAKLFREKAIKFQIELPSDLEVTHCAGGPQVNGEARYYLTFAKDGKNCDVALSTRKVEGDDYAFTSSVEQSRFAKDMKICFSTFDSAQDLSDMFEEPVVEVETETFKEGYRSCGKMDDHILTSFKEEYKVMFKTNSVSTLNCQYIVKSHYREFVIKAKVDETVCEVSYIKVDNHYNTSQSKMNRMKYDAMNKDSMSECNKLVLGNIAPKAKKSDAEKKRRYRQNLKIRQAQQSQEVEKISIDNLEEKNDVISTEPLVEETVAAPIFAPKLKACSDNSTTDFIEKIHNENFNVKRSFTELSCNIDLSHSNLKTKIVNISTSGHECEIRITNKVGDNKAVTRGPYFDSLIAQLAECTDNLPAPETPTQVIDEVVAPTKAKKTKKRNNKKSKKNAVGSTAASLEESESSHLTNSTHDHHIVGGFTDGDWSEATQLYNLLAISNYVEGKVIYMQNIVEVSVQVVNGLNIKAVYSFNGKKCQLNGYKGLDQKMYVYQDNKNFNGQPNLFKHNLSNMPYTIESCLETFGTSLAKELVNKTD